MKTAGIKGLFTAVFFALAVYGTNAQTTTASLPEGAENYDQGFRLGFGLNGGYVFEEPYNAALGIDARLQYDLSKRTSVTLTSGYTHVFLDDDFKDLGFIPVKAGFKGFIWGDTYLLGEIGAGFPVTSGYDTTTMILSPGLGYATKYIDLSVRYEYYKDWADINGNKGIGQLALRIAYGFKL